jgi:hypothetical protein
LFVPHGFAVDHLMHVPPALRGPLGSHTGYIKHIAIQNVMAHHLAKKKHKEDGNTSDQAKYEELRLFLNAIESLNNILDYFYFEHEEQLNTRHPTVTSFRSAAHCKFAVLKNLAELANAYKHCVRTSGAKKNTKLPQASDLQRVALNVSIDLSNQGSSKVGVEYIFHGPIPEHEQVLSDAVGFWTNDYSSLLNVETTEKS